MVTFNLPKLCCCENIHCFWISMRKKKRKCQKAEEGCFRHRTALTLWTSCFNGGTVDLLRARVFAVHVFCLWTVAFGICFLCQSVSRARWWIYDSCGKSGQRKCVGKLWEASTLSFYSSWCICCGTFHHDHHRVHEQSAHCGHKELCA